MKKYQKDQLNRFKKSFLILGILFLVVVGASGCGSDQTAATPQTNQGQTNQGQMQRNPALQAAMEIRRLQGDSQLALTSDQKTKIKPILQDLINTSNPSQDFLQQKADTINAVFTDQQKSYLTNRTRGNNQTNNQNGNNSNNNGNGPRGGNPNGGNRPNGSNNPNGNNRQGGAPNSNQNGRSIQPQDIYKQVLDSLN